MLQSGLRHLNMSKVPWSFCFREAGIGDFAGGFKQRANYVAFMVEQLVVRWNQKVDVQQL